MSFDAEIIINTGIEDYTVEEIGDYTSSASPMFTRALGYFLIDLSDKTCSEVIPELTRAIEDMSENPDEYVELHPSKSYELYIDAVAYLKSILKACKKHPKAKLYIY